MHEDQHQDFYTSSGRRQRTLWIVIAHLLVAGAFFAATFFWGNFS